MAVFTRTKTWVSNEVLTASDLNAEFNNLLNNTIPASIEDYSADVSTMQSTTDPGGSGTESLATTLAGEITRLRYKIKQLMNGTYWYSTPVSTLGNLGILTASINDLAVTTGKINDLAVTRGKQAAVGQQVSSSSSTFTTSSATAVDITNLTVTITTTGRPVFVGLVAEGLTGGGNYSFIGFASTGGDTASGEYLLLRDATQVSRIYLRNTVNAATTVIHYHPPAALHIIDVVAAGTYTYKAQALLTAGNTCYAYNCKLVAYEL